MKIIFMGTPDFAIPSLRTLCENHTVSAVVTQPDKSINRGRRIQYSPVKIFACENNIPVFQPLKLREPENLEILQQYKPDIIVVAAYGQILPKALLKMPRFGCINVHASLLPKYRGAAPIQRAIIDDEKETGITIMQMDIGLDTGDMILQEKMPISNNDTYGTVHDRLAQIGADVLIKAITQIENGESKCEPQNHSTSTYAKMITREDEKIDWSKNTKSILNLIRGLTPKPGAYTLYKGDILKIWKAASYESQIGSFLPGEIINEKAALLIKTVDGFICIDKLQAKNGKIMCTADYLHGHKILSGTILGE